MNEETIEEKKESSISNEILDTQNNTLPKTKKHFWLWLFIVPIFFLLYFLLFSSPLVFKNEVNVNIGEGESLRSISKLLEEKSIIRSRVVFETLVILYGGEKRILPGEYKFTKSSVFEIARIIAEGGGNLVSVKVTIPEGYDTNDIAEIFELKLQNFDKQKFLSVAKDKEGYLFPDTYFFLNTDNEEDVFSYMTNNFQDKVGGLLGEIKKENKSEKEILTMASIIEREAKGDVDREIISGILWKRIKIDMPLQVDAAPNTYNVKGLPMRPIANPGLASIKAALYPKTSPYLYYLHDREGNIHFAKNFDEHRQNKAKYLR